MRKLTGLFVLCFLLSANALQAAEPEKVTSAAESTEISTDKEKKEKVANDGDNYKKLYSYVCLDCLQVHHRNG